MEANTTGRTSVLDSIYTDLYPVRRENPCKIMNHLVK